MELNPLLRAMDLEWSSWTVLLGIKSINFYVRILVEMITACLW